MSETILVDVKRLANLSPYFRHFLQPFGTLINETPTEIDVSFVYHDKSTDSEQVITQVIQLFARIQDFDTALPINIVSPKFLLDLLDEFQLSFLIDVIDYFQFQFLEEMFIRLIQQNHISSLQILRRFHHHLGFGNRLIIKFYNTFMEYVTLPDDLKGVKLYFLVTQPLKQLNKKIRNARRCTQYKQSLHEEECMSCGWQHTFPFYRFGMHLRLTHCCHSVVHEECYIDIIRTHAYCIFCLEPIDNMGFEDVEITRARLDKRRTNDIKLIANYGNFNLSPYIIHYSMVRCRGRRSYVSGNV